MRLMFRGLWEGMGCIGCIVAQLSELKQAYPEW